MPAVNTPKHNNGKSGEMARTGWWLAAMAGLALAACADRPRPHDVGPWGYDFALGTYRDLRPHDDARLMESVWPFDIQNFTASWRRSVGRSVFASAPGTLDVLLERYRSTHSGHSFTLSMAVRLRARDAAGAVLAETPAQCVQVQRVQLADLGAFGQQVARQGSLHPLTIDGRDATMWQKAWDLCVRDLAIQFGQALVAGTINPAAPRAPAPVVAAP